MNKLWNILVGASIDGIPEEHREEFWREIVFVNIRHARIFLAASSSFYLVLIYVINVRNALDFSEAENLRVLYMHLSEFLLNAAVYIATTRKFPQTSRDVSYYHIRLLQYFPFAIWLSLLVFFTVVVNTKGHPIFFYLSVVIFCSALTLPPRLMTVFLGSLLLCLWWAILFFASIPLDVILNVQALLGSSLMTLFLMITAGASFKRSVAVFSQKKIIEKERNLIQLLKDQADIMNTTLRQHQETLEQQSAEIEITNAALQEKNLIIEQDRVSLARERERSERLLLSVLPAVIAERMKSGETHIAEHFPAVTVLFADVVGFTKLSANVNPQELVELLDALFSALDALAAKHGLEKIKTIGDAYMVVAGVPVPVDDHTERVARFALEMQSALDAVRMQWVLEGKELGAHKIQMRVGIHTGEAVAGVIGTSKFAYDLWGDTVNTASRMESHGEAGKIHVSEEIYQTLKDKFVFEERGEIEVKGKGVLRTYYLMGTITSL
ncbi:MAG: hypothetical protein MUF71_10525 [Candidatus Kapabacteria bacterium]|jgi:class 3 adenylate cyclase|nr:hypothetical protein [Candidatus Kapabacteria bacterium]